MKHRDTEQELVQKCKQQDVEAFEQLITAYQKKVLNLAYGMLGNAADAEDTAQEIFIKIFRSIGSFQENSSLSTWIYRISVNVCLDELRKRKKRSGDISMNQQNSDDEEYELSLPDPSASPYQQAQKNAAMEELYKAIEQLSEEQRMAIVLRDLEGMSYDEIAAVTQSTLGTTKSRINRARLALRKILEDKKELFLE